MSTNAPSNEPILDIRGQVIRIDRAFAEGQRFQAEQRKLIAEAARYEREERSWSTGIAFVGGITGLVGGLLMILKALNFIH